MFLMFFYKSEKNMFFVFYLQINVFNIYVINTENEIKKYSKEY